MSGWLSRLVRSVGNLGLGQGRDDPGRLAGEVVRLYEEGRYHEAEAVARQLVDRQRETVGENHPDYATALSNLGLLLQKQGALIEAEPLLRRALEVRCEVLGERHALYAASLSHLAELLQHRGEITAAEPLLRQALEVLKETVGENHPDYATGLTSLALLLHRRGDFAAAEPLLRQALEVRRVALGEHHPHFATALSNLALVLQRRGEREGAETLLRQALDVRKEALGEQHPDYGASLSHLAQLLKDRGDHDGAALLLRQAIAVRTAVLGDRHPDVQADMHTLQALGRARRAASPAPALAPATPEPAPAPTLLRADEPRFTPPPAPPLRIVPAQPAPVTARVPEPPTVLPPRAPVTVVKPAPPPAPTKAPPQVAMPPAPAVAPVAELAPTPAPAPAQSARGTRELADDLRSLGETFSRVSASLTQAARQMISAGIPPEPGELEGVLECRRRFAVLHEQVTGRIAALGPGSMIAPLAAGQGLNLTSLRERVEAIARAEAERAHNEAARRLALEQLDRSSALQTHDGTVAELLRPCRTIVEDLRRQLNTAPAHLPLPAEALRVADGSHPLVALVRLAEAGPGMPDDEWVRLHRAVASAFGKPLAAAAVRKRLAPAIPSQQSRSTPGPAITSARTVPGTPPKAAEPAPRPRASSSVADLTDAVLGDVALEKRGPGPHPRMG